ncbi:MAG: isoprenyl transferase [Clostridiaceae bacterium]|jgi:undecaprenyl diphosphate synthase|nr:isoprenyl transferase [Clostridiaceae bacterium]
MALFKKKIDIDMNNIPKHIAIILDGNGRWAENRGLPRSVGHQEGANAVKRTIELAYDMGVKYITFFAFSSENWSRPKTEVDGLMDLYLKYLKSAEEETNDKNVRIRIIGSRQGLSKEMIDQIDKIEKNTIDKDQMNIIIALNYGGRQDILQATQKIADDIQKGILSKDNITEEDIQKRLYTEDVPDPDLLIRTSGEMRISNFLIWQCSYSEFYFPKVLWPDFREKHFKEAIAEYQRRNRRFGGLNRKQV